MKNPRLVIAAPMSGSGKTTVVAGLIAAFVARGLRVAPFKVGPDYIDPTYHALAAGRAAHNLDAWMLPHERVRMLFAHGAADCDLALIEGVMGLFDGYSGRDDAGSTAQMARLLDAPVLLVLDASAMSRSAAAIVKGLRDFDPRVRVAGVLLNRVGSEGHAQMVTDAIESEVGIPVVGYLPRDDSLNLPERHLGLIPTLEPGRWRAWLDAVGQKIAATVNLDRVLELARGVYELRIPNPTGTLRSDELPSPNARAPHPTIAVARDAAFNFVYAYNLDLLRAAGAEIVFFSPLRDHTLPHGTQALYLCGGFPEIYAAELAANSEMRASIQRAFHSGLPIYAECGGLMYLTEEILDQQNRAHAMVGLLPGRSVMTGQLTLGYRTVRAVADNWLWRAGELVRGHEFHYSTWENSRQDLTPAYELGPNEFQREARFEGTQIGNVFASYVHLHLLAHPDLATRFVAAASKTRSD
ncbi:MAG: cobyrinate a,c-diamide synthase [Chloroflexi bacterium]|nr:cobyrinate a,c-diamide synthase [Chloroflexota bacterium]